MAIQLKKTSIPGCLEISVDAVSDSRGNFSKLFQLSRIQSEVSGFQMKECFISTSVKGAIRGLHFQAPPHDHDKIVFCLSGKVLDVVFDMRKSQPTYGKSFSLELNTQGSNGLFIPKGCAHGFQALEDNSTLLYFTTTEYAPLADQGLRWDSVGVHWPIQKTVISDRDRAFPSWSGFATPFS